MKRTKNFKTLVSVLLLLLLAAATVSAQAVDSGFVWGRDYTFERMTAKRVVNDKEDKGTIRLVACLSPGQERPA